jgi:hypothetical protein
MKKFIGPGCRDENRGLFFWIRPCSGYGSFMHRVFVTSVLSLVFVIFSTGSFAECPGDLDNDGALDGEDAILFSAELGREDCLPATPCRGDIYPAIAPDGVVNSFDLAVFAADFGHADCGVRPSTPRNLFNIGDSIGEGIAANNVIGSINHKTVWSTGYEADDSVYTLNERFKDTDPTGFYANDADRDSIFNLAVKGHEMKEFVDQATKVVAGASAIPSGRVGMITVFLGNNDVCTDEVDNMTDLKSFENRYREGLNILAGSAATRDAYIHVSGIPAIYWLWIAKRDRFLCRVFVWPLVPCQQLLADASEDCASLASDLDPDTDYPGDDEDSVCTRRKKFHRTIRDDYNRILRDVLQEYKESGQLPNAYYIDIFDIQFDDEDVNSGDCFHPSVKGHRVLAQEHWCRSPWNTDGQLCIPEE